MDTPIFDCFDLNYKSPFGAIRQYQPSTFSLRFPKEWHVSDPTLVMFRPGEKERFIPLDITDTTTECNVFTCNFNPLHKGLHHYYFSLMIDGNRRYVKRSGARLGVLDNGELFQLTVFDKDMADKGRNYVSDIPRQILPKRRKARKRSYRQNNPRKLGGYPVLPSG